MTQRPTRPPAGCGAGKIALVTGGNTGIGLAICRALSKLGFDVLLGARSAERGAHAVAELAAGGHQVTCQVLDIADDRSVARAADEIAASRGRLDVLVNNAGVKTEFFPESAKPSETPLEVVRETLATNVIGTIAVIQAMLPLLRRSVGGRIVNHSSGLGSLGWMRDPEQAYKRVTLLGYCTSKTALNAVTVQFANELESTPIKVNSADPGSVATPMNPRATRTPEESVLPAVWLATLGSDGPTGGFFDADGPVPW